MATKRKLSKNQPLMILAASLVLLVVVWLVYRVVIHSKCDSIFEQAPARVQANLEFIKIKGKLALGGENVQKLTDASQKVALHLKTCCVVQQAKLLDAVQFQTCINGAKDYEKHIVQVLINIKEANAAEEQHQSELAKQKTDAAKEAASKIVDIEKALSKAIGVFPTFTPAKDRPEQEPNNSPTPQADAAETTEALPTSTPAKDRIRQVAGAAAGAVLSPFAFGQPPESGIVSVEEQSDFGEPVERLTFNLAQAEAPLKNTSRGPRKDAKAVAAKMLAISQEYAAAGISRSNAEAQITQFLQLFGLPSKENRFPVRYCASGICFAACRAYCEIQPQLSYSTEDPVRVFSSVLTDINHYYFKPNPAVRYIKDDSVKRGTWVELKDGAPKSGWLIVFSFRNDRVPSHIGIVEAAGDQAIQTVEFNTTRQKPDGQSDGGCVARRTRNLAKGGILGYIKTY